MEGSAKNRDAANYELLAYYYDSLLGDEEGFDIWLRYIEEKKFSSVLDLAAGSGLMSRILKDKGYDVVASDLSLEMKEVAKNNFDGEYLIINMTDYHLDRRFDLITCLVDSINYLEEDELDAFFECAFEHLNEGGRLIFDMHHLSRMDEFADEYIEEGHIDDIDYQWTIQSDDFDNIINTHFTFYTKDGMIQENHTQHVFDVKMVEDKMKKTGFKVKPVLDFIPDEKVLMIGEKI